MNYKLYALLLTLTLAISPALQAMRTKTGLLMTARSLGRPTFEAGKQALARTQFTQNNDHEYKQERTGYAYDNYYLPAAAIGSLSLTNQDSADEEDTQPFMDNFSANYFFDQDTMFPPIDSTETEDQTEEPAEPEAPYCIDRLNMSNIPEVLKALTHATDSDKRLVAQKIAQKITRYTTEDVIKMLQCTCTDRRTHRFLVNGIVNNITQYETKQISQILRADPQHDTHELIAYAAARNYKQFTSLTVAGFQIYSHVDWYSQYDDVLWALKPDYHYIALRPVLNNIQKHNILRLARLADARPGSNIKQAVLDAFAQLPALDLEVYDGRELDSLFKITKAHNQTIVARAIANNIKKYNGWHFYGILKECTEESKIIIAAAIIDNIEHTKDWHDYYTLELIAKICNPAQKEVVACFRKIDAPTETTPFSKLLQSAQASLKKD